MGIRVCRFVVVCLLSALIVFAQGTTSRVIGTVLDSTGAAIAGANVTLTNEATNASYSTKTAESGTYVFEAVSSGLYSVAVESAGFRRFISRSNAVAIGQPTTVNVTLDVGQVAEQVEVIGSAEIVQTSTSGNQGNLFTERTITDLPIVGTRGRNPLDLVLLQPGVVSGSNTGGGTHVNGARDRAWNFTVDGIDSNETSAGGSLFSPTRLNPDALAEFRVITSNATAEYGRNSGAQVSMITKSGTNEIHGKGFYFYRTPRYNANEWENNVNARGQRQFVQNIWGGDIGGPILRNKLFFYGNLQFLRARESTLENRVVLTESARRGILRYVIGGRNQPAGLAASSVDPSGNVLPGVNIGTYDVAANDPQRIGLNPMIRGLVGDTPLPNNFNGGDGLNTAFYSFNSLQNEKQHDAMIRIDHYLNSNNTFFGRVNWGVQDTNCDRGNGGAPLFPGRECPVNTTRDPHNMAYSWRWNPNPVVTNELVVGRNKFTFGFNQPFGSFTDYALVTPLSLTVVESTEFGNTRTLQTWQIVDNLAWQRGAHALKFGTNLRFQEHLDLRGSIAGLNSAPRVDFSTTVNPVDPATFGIPAAINVANDRPTFQSLINFLLGRVGARNQGFVASGSGFERGFFDVNAKYNEYDFYAQDTWKARPNLTIDIGLRWEIKMAPTSDRATLAPDQVVVAGAAPSSTLRWVEKEFFKDQWKNFGPSIGFAWDPTSSGKTAIRGNYRIAYDRLPTFLASSFILPAIPGQTLGVTDESYGQSGGRLPGLQPLNPPTQSPDSLTQPPPASANTNVVFDPNLKMPLTHQWAFSIQREVFRATVFEIAYIGRRAYHLFGAYNVNQPEIFANNFVSEFNTVKAGGESEYINRIAAADSRRNAGETPSAMLRRLNAPDLQNNNVGAIANTLATRIQGGRLVTELSGAGTLIPFPQYAGGLGVIDSNDFSTYHGLQVQLERRLANGFRGHISYSFGKSLDTRSFDPVFTATTSGNTQTSANAPFDIYNRKLNYARSDFDRTHVLQSNFLFELPFGRGRRFGSGVSNWTNQIIGGWEFTGIITLQSGRPMTLFSGFNTFNAGPNSTVDCNDCDRSFGSVHDEAGLVWYLRPEERAKMSIPAAGSYGNTGRNFFEGPGSFNMNASALKRFLWGESRHLELRMDVTNLTNTPTFGNPTTTFSSTTFGRIRDTVSSFSRKVQLGAKIVF